MQTIETIQSDRLEIVEFCRQLKAFSLYGVIFSIPLSIASSGICLTLLLLSYLVEMALTKRIPFPQSPLNRPLFAFILITIGLTPFAVDVEKSFSKLTNVVDVMIFFLLYMAIKEQQHIRKYITTLIISVSIASLYGVLQHYLEIDLFRFGQPFSVLKHINNDLSAPARISSFSSYMTFGGQLALILPLIFSHILYSRERRTRILWSAVCMINGSALIWTYTRSAWIASALAMIVIGFMAKGKVFLKYLLLAMLLLSLGLVLLQSLDNRSTSLAVQGTEAFRLSQNDSAEPSAPPGLIRGMLTSSFAKRVFSIFELENNLERLYTWESSFFMFVDHPFTGIGHGNYSKTCEPYRTRFGDFEFTSRAHAHNVIFQVAVIGGIPLLAAFLWFWVTLFRTSYQRYRQTPLDEWESRALMLGVFGALIAFSIHGMFENNFGDSEVLLMLWLLCALFLALPQKSREEEALNPADALEGS